MIARRNRGEGNIQQQPDGRFKVRMSYVDGQGKRHQPTAYFETKKQALSWLHEQHDKHNKGELANSGKRTVGQWLDEWLIIKKPQVEPNTYAAHEQHVRLYLVPQLGRTPLAKLRPPHVASLYTALADKGISPTTQKHAAVTLSAALNLAVKMGFLANNPARSIAKPKADPAEIHPLDGQQVRDFLDATASDRLHALYVLALDSGMRQGEIFALHWPEVDFDTGVITVKQSLEERNGNHRLKKPKTKWSRRSFRVSPVTLDALNTHRQRQLAEGFYRADGPVFCNARGGLIHKPNFYTHSFFPAKKRAGLPGLRFHDLRHTSATLMLLSGINVKAVATMLGHKDAYMTLNVYSHVLPQMNDERAAVMQRILTA
ncbi:MAG: tyrosine-type recombinase/integrase [Gemmataceae bacterium]